MKPLCQKLCLTPLMINRQQKMASSATSHNYYIKISTLCLGFERFMVLYFTRIFRNGIGKTLGDVFKFVGCHPNAELNDIRASLVTVHRSSMDAEGSFNYSEVIFEGRTINLPGAMGQKSDDSKHFLSWLQHTSHPAFCFPHTSAGPDLAFVLKLHTEPPRYVWVLVQAKCYTSCLSLNTNLSANAICSCTPRRIELFEASNTNLTLLYLFIYPRALE